MPDDQVGTFDMRAFERLVQVETKLDELLDRRNSERSETHKLIQDHEQRIRSLERIWWKAIGMSAAIGSLVASGASIAIVRLLG